MMTARTSCRPACRPVAGMRSPLSGASQEMQTRSFTLTKEQLQADYYYQDGARNTRRDAAGGVAWRIYQGDKEVFAWGSDDDLVALAKGDVETSASQSQ